MKLKIMLIVICIIIPLSGYAQVYSLGDVNHSGGIDIVDALVTAQAYVGLNPEGYNSSLADVNRDGRVDIVDALLIAQYYVGLIDEFPGQSQSYTLILNVTGSGSTNPGAGSHTYSAGTSVSISAIPQKGWGFTGWSGDASGNSNPMIIKMTGNIHLSANFSLIDTSVTFSITNNLFDSSQPGTLGLSKAPGTETITVFSSTDDTDHYCNGVALITFKGKLYTQWQSSKTDEDSSDSWVAYSVSEDGTNWEAPKRLELNADGTAYKPGYARTSGGWWTDGNTLVAYINAWPGYSPRGGDVYYRTSTDGEVWSQAARLTDNNGNPLYGIFEQDPHGLPNGRILGAAHIQSGGEGSGGLYCYPFYTDDPLGISGWTKGDMSPLSSSGSISAELEPSSFYRADGGIVMVFRDQSGSYKKLASLSADNGETWTRAAVTNMPDSRSKQSAGNLPDGTAFQVSDPSGNKSRYPLVVALSREGKVFDKAFLLRSQSELPDRRYSGKAKTLGYSYPKSTIWNAYLYVGYSVNKEDINITRVPVSSLVY